MAPNFTTQTEGSFELEIGSNEPLSVRRRLSCRHLQQPFECKITRLVFFKYFVQSREEISLSWMMKSNRYVDILARTCQRRRTKVIGIVGPYVATFCWDLLFLSAPTTRHRKNQWPSDVCYHPKVRRTEEENPQCNHLHRKVPGGDRKKVFLLPWKSRSAAKKNKFQRMSVCVEKVTTCIGE